MFTDPLVRAGPRSARRGVGGGEAKIERMESEREGRGGTTHQGWGWEGKWGVTSLVVAEVGGRKYMAESDFEEIEEDREGGEENHVRKVGRRDRGEARGGDMRRDRQLRLHPGPHVAPAKLQEV